MRRETSVMRDLHQSLVDYALACPPGKADAEWLRMSRPRRTKLKGHPMTGANAIVSSVPVAVRRDEG